MMLFPKHTAAAKGVRFKRKSILIAVGLTLAIATPTTLIYGKHFGKLPAAVGVALASQQSSPLYRWQVGQQLLYKLDYQNTAKSDLRVLFSEQKQKSAAAPSSFVADFQNRVKADLVMTVLEKQPGRILVSYRFKQPQVSIVSSDQAIKEQAELVQQELQQEIFATVNQQGEIVNLRFPRNTSRIGQIFARSVLASIQFVTSQNSDQKGSWETQESDLNGEYIARYQLGLTNLEKTKLRYIRTPKSTATDDAKIEPIITPTGSLQAVFDREGGYLKRLVGEEAQRFNVSKKNVGQGQTKILLLYTSQTKIADQALQQLRKTAQTRAKTVTAVTLSHQLSDREADRRIHRQQLGSSTLASLLSELNQLDKAKQPDENATTNLYLKFKALVALQPDKSAALAQQLRNVDASSLSMQMLVGALSATGHGEAQAALVQIIQNRRHDVPTLLGLIPSLSNVPEPTIDTVKALEDLAFKSSNDQIASTAQLSLGTIAKTLRQIAPKRATAIADQFLARLKAADTSEQIKLNLLVLGNAGIVQSMDAIVTQTKSSNAEIRAVAFASLRWMQSDAVDRLMTQALQQDSDELVRAETAVALGFRAMTPANFAVQKQVFAVDKSERVRLALLKNLWQARDEFPEVVKLVQTAAAKDASEDVRKAASEVIAALES